MTLGMSETPIVQSVRELAHKELPDTQWAVQELIPEGVTLFSADPKTGKTLLMLGLCLDMSKTRTVFGKYVCSSDTTLYVSWEESQRKFQNNFKTMQPLVSLSKWPASMHVITNENGGLPSMGAGGLTALDNLCSVLKPRLAVLDVWQTFRPAASGSNQYATDYADIQRIKQVAIARNCAIVILHHTNKSDRAGFGRISGTNGLRGAADANWIMSKLGARRARLSVEGRELESKTFQLVFDKAALRWQIVGDDEELSKQWRIDKIISVLQSESGEVAVREIIDETELAPGYVRKTLRRLAKNPKSEVECVSYGKYKWQSKTAVVLRKKGERNV